MLLCCKKEYSICCHQPLMGKAIKQVNYFFRGLKDLESFLMQVTLRLQLVLGFPGKKMKSMC